MRFACLLALVFVLPIGASEPVEALDLVNAQRAKYGLPPYQRDAALTEGAAKCAAFRAERLWAKHTSDHDRSLSDFQFLPAGCWADAGGCAAWTPEMGFGACAMYETQYKTAGAAYVVGRDGKRYCQLFVRRGPPSVQTSAVHISPQAEPTVKQLLTVAPAISDQAAIEANDRGKIVCVRKNSDGTFSTYEEDKPAWLSNGGDCLNGSCAAQAKQMPATIQNCPTGK